MSFIKKSVITYFIFTLLSAPMLQGAETVDLKLNVKKGDKQTYISNADFALYVDLPPAFLKEIKADPNIDEMTKKMFVEPAEAVILSKKPIAVFNIDLKDNLEITNVSESKDRISLDYAFWITKFFAEEHLQGNKIVFDAEHPENNFTPPDFPFAFKDPKSVFPIVLKFVLDQKGRLLELVDHNIATDKLIDNISSPMATPDMITGLKNSINEFIVNQNEELKNPENDSYTFYPPGPVKVGDSWTNALSPKVEAEWKQALAENKSEDEKRALEMAKKVYEKIGQIKNTLKSRQNGVATIALEMANKDDVSIAIPGDYKVEILGNLIDGTIEIDEATGTALNSKINTDIGIRLSYTGKPEDRKKTDPEYAELRFKGTSTRNVVK